MYRLLLAIGLFHVLLSPLLAADAAQRPTKKLCALPALASMAPFAQLFPCAPVSAADQAKIRVMIEQLGNDAYTVRERATADLISVGLSRMKGARSRLAALRFAWRELRGGLGGFAVFIACIALGVMAIAGVGSFAASLADGIAMPGAGDPRRRPRLLPDPARSERRRSAPFSRRTAPFPLPPRCAPWRAPATGAPHWSRSRRSTPPIRCSARSWSIRRCRSA